ncbi:hypothetical protein BDP27DRAFT_1538732 [Rhodocollybia butyracea]|uniref:Transmembrane protein n=1 Tax=Rhodocollybia butyracea TaxID=206335 RepID=A0A9P5PJT0_9AGAR|nr:hypothetical protein BDP27DRAFT_1538732 [Rhodocollybia butyracea]
MTGAHRFSVNQHAIHHIHARFMSNVVVGPGGQVTLVGPAPTQTSIAQVTLSASSAQPQSSVATISADLSQQASSSILATAGNSPMNTVLTTEQSTTGPVYISTTVFVTSEVAKTSSSMSTSSSDSSLASSTLIPVASVSTTASTSHLVAMPTINPSSSSTVSHSSVALAASSTSTVNSTSSVTKDPTLYVGIVLGTIVVIACLAALVAWCLRLRTHSRRRPKIAVPWADRPESSMSTFTISDLLEKGQSSSSHGDPHQRNWEPRGDRDAGEPRRTTSYLENVSSPVKRRPGPILGLPSLPPVSYPVDVQSPDHSDSYPGSYTSSLGHLQESAAYPLPNVNSSRPLPSQSDYLQRNINLHPNPPSVHIQFLTDPEFGTPRESMLKPRYLTLPEQGLDLPWDTEAPESVSEFCDELPSHLISEANLRSPGSLSEKVQQPAPVESFVPSRLPVPSAQSQSESWSSSIKANLVYAFNAVAKAAGGVHSQDQYDKLTPLPSRNTSRNRKTAPGGGTRLPVQETGWVEYFGGELVGKAPSRTGSPRLEETSEGRGVVRFPSSISQDGYLPFPSTLGGTDPTKFSLGLDFGGGLGLEGYRGNDHAFSPLPSAHPSFTPTRMSSTVSCSSTAPLVVKKKKPSVRSTSSSTIRVKNSGSQRRPKYAYGGQISSRAGSRKSSVASRASKLHALPSFGRRGSEASSLSRMSSMRSMKSTRSVLSDREELARKALAERRRWGKGTVQ